MIRVAILTCLPNDMASLCLPALVSCRDIEIAKVILAYGGGGGSKWKYLWRRIKKICKIGPLGAWNGIKMRTWFRQKYPNIEDLCRQYGVPFQRVQGLNSTVMSEAISACKVDLGLSLGNGFIAERIFRIPKYGMINIHSEILPAYQNAQQIIWPIYCNDPYTGFTIHEIERKIDVGRILLQKRVPINFQSTLQQTVEVNKRFVWNLIPESLVDVCTHLVDYRAKAKVQLPGGHYTTPSFWQFLRMKRNNARFYRLQQEGLLNER